MTTTDRWASGTAYDRYVGRWSRHVADEFLPWLDIPAGRRWLDLGSGTGRLTEAILAGHDPASVVGVDPSPPFVEHARAAVADPRVTFQVGTAADTGLADDTVDVVVTGLVLNFVPDVRAALTELARVVVPDGTVAAYVWDYADGMEFMRLFWDAATAEDAAAREVAEAGRFPIAAPGPLEAAFVDAGFAGVEVRAIVIPTVFRGWDDLWDPFLGGTGSAPTYLAGVDEVRRVAIRERLRAMVEPAPDGTIPLHARAWAVRGRAPGTAPRSREAA